MARGENIFKRKDGRWEARYSKGYDASGKIKYGFCYGKTYREAKAKAAAARTNFPLRSERLKSRENYSFAFYCEEWLTSIRDNVKESTYVKYESMLRNHIIPQLGKYSPEKLDTTVISSFSSFLLTESKLSAKTVRDNLTCLRSIIRFTEKHFPESIRMFDISYPKELQKEMRVLSIAEQIKLTRFLIDDMDPCKLGVLLALFTGMRIGELCALRWSDIDLHERIIRIHSTMQRLKSDSTDGSKTKVTIGSPKSDKSSRTIPLTGQAVFICTNMRAENNSAFVLTGNEKYMEPRTLQNRFSRYTAECELDGVHFHTLRHTFATRCVEVGFEIKTLSEILGHSSTKVTLDRYVHSSIELKRANMSKLELIGM